MSISIRRDGTTGTRHILKIRNHEIPVDASPAGGLAGVSTGRRRFVRNWWGVRSRTG